VEPSSNTSLPSVRETDPGSRVAAAADRGGSVAVAGAGGAAGTCSVASDAGTAADVGSGGGAAAGAGVDGSWLVGRAPSPASTRSHPPGTMPASRLAVLGPVDVVPSGA